MSLNHGKVTETGSPLKPGGEDGETPGGGDFSDFSLSRLKSTPRTDTVSPWHHNILNDKGA